MSCKAKRTVLTVAMVVVRHLMAAAGEDLGGSESWTDSWISPSEEQLDAAAQAILSNPALGLQDQASATANPMFGDESSKQQQQQQQPLLATADEKELLLAVEPTHQARPNDEVSHLFVT